MKTRYAAAVVISSLAYAVELDTTVEDTFQESAEYEGNVYTFHNRRRSWRVAEMICNDEGGHLVSIHSQEEQDFVQGLVDSVDEDRYEYHIGLNDRQREGQWVWSDSTEFDFDAWKPGQPDNKGWFGQDCAQSGVRGGSKKWTDRSCNWNWEPFVCKRPADYVPRWLFVDRPSTWASA